MANVEDKEVEEEEEEQAEEPAAKTRPMAKAGAQTQEKADTQQRKQTRQCCHPCQRYLTLHHPHCSRAMHTTSAWLHIQGGQVH